MKSTLKKSKKWIIGHQADIILVIGVMLISLLSFAMGYITAKTQENESLRFETLNSQLPISNENPTNE